MPPAQTSRILASRHRRRSLQLRRPVPRRQGPARSTQHRCRHRSASFCHRHRLRRRHLCAHGRLRLLKQPQSRDRHRTLGRRGRRHHHRCQRSLVHPLHLHPHRERRRHCRNLLLRLLVGRRRRRHPLIRCSSASTRRTGQMTMVARKRAMRSGATARSIRGLLSMRAAGAAVQPANNAPAHRRV